MAVVHAAIVGERHRRRQQVVARLVAGHLEAALAALPDLSEEQLAAYVDFAFPTVAGGQAVAADTGASYAQVLAGGRKPRRSADVDAALARSGVLVQPDSRSLVAPVLRARHLVAEGEAMPAAIVTAASYAGQLSAADLQAAMRVGVDEGAAASGLQTQGWQKALAPDACDWCQLVAAGTYRDPDSVPFHDGDKCGVEPVLDDAAPSRFDDSDIPF